MKAEIYVFGNFSYGYSQYPDNYTRDLFKTVSDSRKGASEIVYRREGSLTYYIYMREISRSSNTFIGLCYVFNDIIIRDLGFLFGVFEDAITNIVVKGELLEFADDGSLSTKVNQLYTNTNELQRIAGFLNSKLSSLGWYAEKLPPANYSVSTLEWKVFTFDQISSAEAIIDIYSNVRIIKGENYDTEALRGYAAKLKKQDVRIKDLQHEINDLKKKNAKLKVKSRNIVWVGALSVVVISLFIILYLKVINPSEVTHYETGEFIYYGPLKDKKPHGIGVAIYPTDDQYGRKYYIGNFVRGKRQDSNAMLFYRDGDYYYGSMNDDEWGNGMFYMNSDDSYFRGDFISNMPYNGTWYEHKKRYDLIKGEKRY